MGHKCNPSARRTNSGDSNSKAHAQSLHQMPITPYHGNLAFQHGSCGTFKMPTDHCTILIMWTPYAFEQSHEMSYQLMQSMSMTCNISPLLCNTYLQGIKRSGAAMQLHDQSPTQLMPYKTGVQHVTSLQRMMSPRASQIPDPMQRPSEPMQYFTCRSGSPNKTSLKG